MSKHKGAQVAFSTKAGTLAALQGYIKCARIAPLATLTVGTWREARLDALGRIPVLLGVGPWIVRSSCSREDGSAESNAGAFLSVLNVVPEGLEVAIEQVIASYHVASCHDEVLIQPMLRDVTFSGVAFSHDPNSCAPYRVVNWSEGGDTTAVTAGDGGRIWQQAARSPVPPPPQLSGVLALIEELLKLFDNTPIDLEFAATVTDGREELWLLQARPLVLRQQPETEEDQERRLSVIHDKVVRGMSQHPYLIGQRTAYGVMPDWNPAEIISVRPKPLALSLYRDLITDSIWAYQRHNYGYRNLRSFALMPHFFGSPYIDVRLSFNSFIPADLDEALAGRLVDHYVTRLLAEPTLHDKVEFEIVFSCYSLDLPERLKRLDDLGFSRDEKAAIADSLRRLTNRIIHPKEGLWRTDAGKLETLNLRRDKLLSSQADLLERIYWLLEDAKRYGTLPFAGLARAGFIAVQMLKSLVSVGVFSQTDYDAFLGSLSTVTRQLEYDRGTLDRATFLARYGHLRPGTYDILSPRYDEAPDLYFDWNKKPEPKEAPAHDSLTDKFSLTLPQLRELVKLLELHNLHPDPVGLLDFLQAGIQLREMAKFHFTRNLSDVMALIGEYGSQYGFSREELAYCDVAVFHELHVAAADPKDALRRSVEKGKARYEETLKLSLPPLITRPADVWAFEWAPTEPNFITQKEITASPVDIADRDRLTGSIVCIPNADPGFDWLFGCRIAGLITAWGGVNSHMAIRSGELGLPAVIGAGEVLYRRWSGAKTLHLNCGARRVEILA